MCVRNEKVDRCIIENISWLEEHSAEKCRGL